jgi:hypothetical protein
MQHTDIKDFIVDISNPRHGLEPTSSMFYSVLIFFKKNISPLEKTKLNESFLSMKLCRDVLRVNKKYDVYNVESQNHKYGVPQVCGLIQKLFGFDSLDKFNLDSWDLMIDGIIMHDEFGTAFSENIGHKFCKNIRTLGHLLRVAHSDERFILKGIGEPSIRKALKEKHKGRTGNPETTLYRLIARNPSYNLWNKSFDNYLDELILKTTKPQRSALAYFLKFVMAKTEIKDPIIYFAERRPDFYNWLVEQKSTQAVSISRGAQMYSMWFVNKQLTDYTEESAPVTIGFLAFDERRYNYITKQKNSGGQSKNSESPKLAMPTKFVSLCKDILSANDYAFPKSLGFEYYESDNGRSSYWCPVNTILFLIMLELPLRKIQVTSLDSGEGDNLWYDNKQKKWIKNTSTHAGYWGAVGAKQKVRGVLSPSSTTADKVDLYINTNKTADIKEQFSEKSGYKIPWHNETVIGHVNFLRTWQEKNNPVECPLSYADIPQNTFANAPTKGAIEIMPDRFYLFRSWLNTTSNEAPVADFRAFKFWHHLMEELEKRLHESGEDLTIILKRKKTSNEPIASIFTPHGLRVTGLTSFMEAGVPIEVLSKIVAGHASILMTLHYIKYNNAHISDVLNKAQKEIEDSSQQNFSIWLKETSWSDAEKYSVFNDSNHYEGEWSAQKHSLFENRQLGICPTAGTTCNTGGKIVHKAGIKKVYGPVSGGAGNCIMCRYFITGKPWLVPLWLKTNTLLAESSKLSQRLDETRSEMEKAKKERFNAMQAGGIIPAQIKAKIQHLESSIDKQTLALDMKLNESHRAYNLLEKVRLTAEFNEGSSSVPIPIDDQSEQFVFDEVSHFKQLDFIVQAGREYLDFDTEIFEKDRDHFIDTVLFNSGITPITLTPLSKEEKQAATDAAAKYLVQSLTDQELEQLKENSVTLTELGYKSQVEENITKGIEANQRIIPVTMIGN